MPTWDGLFVAFALKSFVTPYHLGIARIFDFVPSADGVVRKIWCGLVFCHDALQVHLAHSLIERGS